MDDRSTAEPWVYDPLRLRCGFERAFGGVADALGLGPARRLHDAVAGLMAAAWAGHRAQVELAMQVGSAWPSIEAALAERLRQQGLPGQSPESVPDFLRWWSAAADDAIHGRLQSEPGLNAVAAWVRALAQSRSHFNRVVEIASESCNVPTRAETDDALREIQQLKRRLRSLERQTSAATPEDRPRARRAGAAERAAR